MTKPNILLVVSDQERQRDWLPPDFDLPNRQRLIDGGLEFRHHYTNTSPCSPSRATLFTGQHMRTHGVTENSTTPRNTQLPHSSPTLGKLLRSQGYTTAYKGKWHLEATAEPDMEAYGFGAWSGNDMAWWGLPGSGTEYDPVIAHDAAEWLRNDSASQPPWFLTVALVNPHDVMWFPLDQSWYRDSHPTEFATAHARLSARSWGRQDNLPIYPHSPDRLFDTLPANFGDDLTTKPEVHRRWLDAMLHASSPGDMPEADADIWLRQLDYYADLHRLSDIALGEVLGALDDSGQAADTIVIFTSDHGDQCGSHGLRSKGPWNYQETLRIPLYMVVPGLTVPGSTTDALSGHIDLAATIADLAGVELADHPDIAGSSLLPLFAGAQEKVRDYVLFSQDWAWYPGVEDVRYASSGVFDGRYKYCRYFAGGDGIGAQGQVLSSTRAAGDDDSFDDQEHELYDLHNDPHELENLANDPGRRNEIRRRFEELRDLERSDYSLA